MQHNMYQNTAGGGSMGRNYWRGVSMAGSAAACSTAPYVRNALRWLYGSARACSKAMGQGFVSADHLEPNQGRISGCFTVLLQVMYDAPLTDGGLGLFRARFRGDYTPYCPLARLCSRRHVVCWQHFLCFLTPSLQGAPIPWKEKNDIKEKSPNGTLQCVPISFTSSVVRLCVKPPSVFSRCWFAKDLSSGI